MMLVDRGFSSASPGTAFAVAVFMCLFLAVVAWGDPLGPPPGSDGDSTATATPDSASAWSDSTGAGGGVATGFPEHGPSAGPDSVSQGAGTFAGPGPPLPEPWAESQELGPWSPPDSLRLRPGPAGEGWTPALAPGPPDSVESAALAGDSTAPAPFVLVWRAVGVRIPDAGGPFTRPWSSTEPVRRRGLRPPSVIPPRAVPSNLPFVSEAAIDLETGWMRVEEKAGESARFVSYAAPLEEFRALAVSRAFESGLLRVTRAELGGEGPEGPGGLLDFDIPMPLPGPFVRAIGPGANLKVRGSERITFGGQTSYVVDELAQESGPSSRFPQLNMEQNLTVNLEGTIGRKIHVYVDHRSGGDAFGVGKANQVRVHYDGDEDEIIQGIELGEVNLSLPGTEFVSYSGGHEGLFGAKMTAKVGKLDLVTIASKEEGKTSNASFTGTSEADSVVIFDINYKKRTFFAVGSDVLKYSNVVLENVRVFVDDGNGGNDLETGAEPGVAYLTEGVPFSGGPPSGADAQQPGMFDEVFELEDFLVDYQTGVIEFIPPIPFDNTVAVTYKVLNGATYGSTVGDTLRLKMIKKDGRPEAEWEPVRNYELKNIYDLGAEDIPEDGFQLRIRERSPSGEVLDTHNGVPLIQILGLDTRNLTGDPTPDGIVDLEWIDFEKGYLVFPHFTPFCPAYDEDTNFYYPAGDTADYRGFARELGPDGYNCAVYQKEVFQPDDDVYFIEVGYNRPRTTFYLGQLNIIENSEVVRLNGVRLTRGVDYTIYYPAGQLTLLSEEAKEPDARVTVEYDYKPFGIGGEKTLLGTRGVYNWSENIQLGTTWMYQSKGTPEDRPRLGEEPSRTVVGDVNVVADFEPGFMTSLVDAIPLVDTDAPSRLKISAETAVSIPEPNTKGFVSIDDMEGAENVSILGVNRRLWVPSSVPESALLESPVADSTRMRVEWYNPYQKVDRGDIYPVLYELNPQEADDNQVVLEVAYDEDQEHDWAGLMRLLSKTGNDYSDYEFIEFWINAGSDPRGTVRVDLGTISEDFYPLRASNGVLNTEDEDRNGFDADEDLGLDNAAGEDEDWYPGSPDDGDDDYFYEYQSNDYSKINGTEGNELLDTEDLNGNWYLDTDNRYWEFTVDLADSAFLVARNDTFGGAGNPYRNDWRLYRVPLADAEAVGGITDWSVIKSARVWFQTEDRSREWSSFMLATLDIVGNQWEVDAIRDSTGAPVDTLATGETFAVQTRNTREDENYVPPYTPEAEEDTGVLKREQSLALVYENLEPGHEGSARKVFYSDEDYTAYQSLEFYVHGEAGIEEGTVFFIRLGADTLNYYEYSFEVRAGWGQDPTAGDKLLRVPFTSLTNLKLDPYAQADSASVAVPSSPVQGEVFRRVGWPSLSRVSRLTVGVRNGNGGPSTAGISGEIWVDDIQLGDVRKEIGWAERATIDATFADLASFNFDLRHVDGDFHTLKQKQGLGQDNLTYNLSGTVNADRFVSDLGLAVPVNVTWKRSTTRPKFSTGSDIVLSDEQSNSEKTEVLERSLAASLSRKKQSENFWTHLFLDGLSLRGSVSDHKRAAPTKADTSRSVRGRVSYRYSPEKSGIRLFGNTHFYLKPTSVRFSTDALLSHSLSYDISPLGVKTLRTDNWDKKLSGEGSIDFQFLDNLKTTHSVSSKRDLARPNRRWLDVNLGLESERRYANSLSFNPKFGTWFAPQYNFASSYTDNHGPEVRRPGEPPGVRDLRAQDSQEVRASFDLKKLFGTGAAAPPRRPPGRRTGGAAREAPEGEGEQGGEEGGGEGEAGADTEPEEGPGLRVLVDPVLTLIRRMDAIEGRYQLKRTSRYDGITEEELPGTAYILGLKTGLGADDRTEERTISFGSGVKLTNEIRLKGDFQRTTSGRWYKNALLDTVDVISRTESMNQSTDGSLSWSGLEKFGVLSGLCSSVRARSGIEFKRSYSGPYGQPTNRGEGLSLNPIVSVDATFKNGLTTSFSWDRKRSRGYSLTGVGSVTEDITGSKSLTVNYRFSAPQGLKLPFFGQKLRFQSNLDLSLTVRSSSKETRTAPDENVLVSVDPSASTRDLSVTGDATYSFSRSVSGGLQISWSQNQDVKRDRTRRTIGVHLTAEFKF
jgi:hypothetical protein